MSKWVKWLFSFQFSFDGTYGYDSDVRKYDYESMVPFLDFVVIMAYDLRGVILRPIAWANSPLNYTQLGELVENNACHPGGHYWNYYPGTLSWIQVTVTHCIWRFSSIHIFWICPMILWVNGEIVLFTLRPFRPNGYCRCPCLSVRELYFVRTITGRIFGRETPNL